MNTDHLIRTLKSVTALIQELENGDYLIPKEGKDVVQDLIIMTGIIEEEQDLIEQSYNNLMNECDEFYNTSIDAYEGYRYENNLF